VGETSEAGAACAAGLIGSMLVLQSIMGKFGWDRKELRSEVEDVDLGSSTTEDGESELGMGSNEVGTSLQKVPAAEPGSFGLLGVSRTPSTSLGATTSDVGAIRLVPASLGATEDGESELGLGSNAVGTSLQKVPAVESGSSGLLGVSGSSSMSLGATTGDVGAELSTGLI
jgi:hypothetical protein